MNKQQLDRIEARIKQAAAEFVKAKMAPLGERPKVARRSNQVKLDLIYSGQATLKPRDSGGGDDDLYGYLTNMFTYPLTPEMAEAERQLKAWTDAHDAVTAQAGAIEQSLMDQAVLSKDGLAVLDRIAAAFATPT